VGQAVSTGTQVAGYRLEELVGRGGMGVVYRAHDLALERSVALKLLAPELAEDTGFRERFLVESRLAASLDHPNVVPIYDAGEVEGQLYLAMRYVDGSDLKALLQEEGALEPARAIQIVSQVAEALDAAHARGLVHRDVKPSNVLLDETEHAYLADFGLTRRLAEQAPDFEAGLSLGTPAYVAPEQIEGKELDGRADQYSLACLLCECLSGEPPFPRSSEAAVLFAHLEETPPAPPGLEQVMAKALAKQPKERYGSCRELVDAARSALSLEPKRVRRPVVAAAVVVAVVAAGLAAFFLARGGGAEPRTTAPPAGDGKVVRIDPATGKTRSAVAFGQDLSDVAVGPGSVWVASLGSGTLARIDSDSGRLDETISVAGAGSGPSGIAVSGGLVWIVNGGDDKVRLYKVRDKQFSNVERPLPAGVGCACPGEELPAVADGPWLWTVSRAQHALKRFAAEQSTVDPTPLRTGSAPAGLAIGESAVWVVTTIAVPTLFKIDSTTNRIIGVRELGSSIPSGVAAGKGAVWVANLLDDTVIRIEPHLRGDSPLSHSERLDVMARIRVGRAPNDVAVGEGSVWVVNYLDGTLSRIDSATNAVTGTFKVGPYPDHVAVGEGSVWVTLDPP
jgi:YVTN family beta-propeller protein